MLETAIRLEPDASEAQLFRARVLLEAKNDLQGALVALEACHGSRFCAAEHDEADSS